MSAGVLLLTHEAFADHDTGPGHPERPARLEAVLSGIRAASVADAITWDAPAAAPRADLERVHPALYLDAIERFCLTGGGHLDPDTAVSRASWAAAVLAAGAGITAVAALEDGRADAAFCAVRPPGHHASAKRGQGFCLINNIAVTAAALADRGERVLIFDFDAHHGNGTQDIFYGDDRVLFVSLHQSPLYPFTGSMHETGAGEGAGLTVNFPMPPTSTGDAYLAAFDEVVAPLAERFKPTWVLLSAGFDSHRYDPLAHLSLSAGDYALLTSRVMGLVPAGRRIAFLEGGYDLDALAASAGACVAALAGEVWVPRGEEATSGGPGRSVVDAVASQFQSLPQ